MRVVVYRGAGIQPWRFKLVSDNHQIMTQSEGYLTLWNATRAARRAFPDEMLIVLRPEEGEDVPVDTES